MYKQKFLLALLLLSASNVFSQASFTGTGYSQNFDGLGTSGTNLSSLLTGWSHHWIAGAYGDWVASIPSSGTPSAATNGTTNNTLRVNSAAATAGYSDQDQAYNLSLSGSTSNRSLGTSPTSNCANVLQLILRNNSGSARNSFTISYTIRRFTTSVTSGGVPSDNELPGYRLFYSLNGTTWTNVTALNPVISGGTYNVPNTPGTSVITNFVINFASGATWSEGADLRLRWVDDNSFIGPDQVIGLDDLTLAVPSGAGLPVRYNHFSAVPKGDQVHLQWQVASCNDLSACAIEYSTDGKQFNEIGSLPALKQGGDYHYTANQSSTTGNWYRIRFVYEDGSSEWSKMVLVNKNKTSAIKAYPTLVNDHIYLEMGDEARGRVEVVCYNAAGVTFCRRSFQHPGGIYQQRIDLPENLLSGLFYIQVTTSNGQVQVIKAVH